MSGVNSDPSKLPGVDPSAYNQHPPSARLGQGYDARHKVPSVSTFLQQQAAMTEDHSAKGEQLKQQQLEAEQRRQAAAERDSSGSAAQDGGDKRDGGDSGEQGKSAGQLEKDEAMKKARANPQTNAQDFERKGVREVFDPVTGRQVQIKDADLADFQKPQLFDPEHIDPAKADKPGPALNRPGGGAPLDKITPNPVEPTNLNLYTFPPPVDQNSLKAIVNTINGYALAVIGALAVIWFFTAWRGSWAAFLFRTQLIGGIAVAIFFAHGIVTRKVEKELERIRLEMHKQRGEQHSPPTPESTEWLNAFVKVVWPLINPELFTSVVDMVEDVIQASLPGFVDAVKIEDFTLGNNAFRILNMRALPDQPSDKEYPREEWIDQGDREAALDPNRRVKSEEQKEKEKQDKADAVLKEETPEDEDQAGDYVNYEISFAYFAPPGEAKSHNKNISLIMKFFLGAYDLFHLPVPIWIAVESVVGTVRLRCQMVSEAPFIRNVTFTLMGVPAVEASAIPMTRALPNVLDLPLVSGLVQSSIAAAASIYCAPKSMTLNIAQMLAGDGVKRECASLGYFFVQIHHASGLSAQDDNGYSDPYVAIAFAKFGRPLATTRIITQDLNPVWEQHFVVLVTAEEVRAGEALSIQLWDNDKISADDLVGRVNVPVTDLMLKPNEMQHRTDELMGFEDADSMSGTLTWSVGYYEKAKLNPSLKKAAGIDHTLPKELQDHPELKLPENKLDTAEEADVARCPPDPQWPSGILSVIVHHLSNVESQNLKGATGRHREGAAGQDTDEPSEQGDNVVSTYVEYVLNDDLIFKTRTKQFSSMPYFECGTEAFVRDFRKATLRLVVRDARLREHDPILGIINLPLNEVFAHSSQVTRTYSLRDGVGFGKAHISLLFKGVQLSLPKELSGFDTGTVCVTAPVCVEPVADADFDWAEKKLILSTSEAKQKIPGRAATQQADGSLEWEVDDDIRLPTYDRYSSALYFDYGGSKIQIGPLGSKRDAYATLWLSELVDDEPKEVRIPVIVPKSPSLRANYINDQCKKTHDYDIVAWLTTTVVLDSGLDADHEAYATTQTQRHEFETYDRIEGQSEQAVQNSHANDDGVIDKEEQKQIDRAHKKALESRHRGKMQYRPIRTAIWAKDGAKDRLRKLTGRGKKEETVASEGA
ncbi:hypothetical protein JCM9279_003279 [Rhodotorula babjevae]